MGSFKLIRISLSFFFLFTTLIPTGFSETDPYVMLDAPGEEYGTVVSLEEVNRSVNTNDSVGEDDGILHFLMGDSPLSEATPEPEAKEENVAQAISPEAFLFESGTVTIEAENYFLKTQPGSKSWDFDTSQAGFAGTGALRLNPNTGTKLSETQTALSPRLDYKIYVPEGAGGDYKIWVRGAGSTIYDDSVHFGVDGVVQSTSDRLVVDYGIGLNWSNTTMDNNDTGVALLSLTPGEHTINVWMREDGFVFDKFLLTSTSDIPAGQGPAESAQEGAGGPDPVDITAPVISNVQTSVTETSVTITWDTDEPATSQVEYGLTSGLGTFTTVDTTLKTLHSVTINGLTPDTPYFFKTLSEDEATNPAESPVTSFTTVAEPVQPEISPESYLFENGTVVIEAENFYNRTQPGSKSWDSYTGTFNFSGETALRVIPNTGTKLSESQTNLSPRLDYKIYVPEGEGGQYKIWIRGQGNTIYDDSIHVGVDGSIQVTSDRVKVNAGDGFNWSNTTMDNNDTGVALLNLTPGEHTLNIWMREDGFVLDKLLLTNTSDIPSGHGPAESAQQGDSGSSLTLLDQNLSTNEGVRKTMILGPETTIASSVPVSYSFTADSILTTNGTFTLLDNQLMYLPDEGFMGSGQIHVTGTYGSDVSTSTIDLEVKAPTVSNPNDTFFSSLYQLALTDAVRAWGLASGLGVTVAIIDSGIDLQHVDLNDNLYLNEGEIAGDGIDNDGNGFIDDLHGWDFENNDNDPDDDFFHGTHVAGIVAAEAGNGTGVAGLAKDANLMALKVLDSDGGGIINTVFQNVANSIDYAVAQGAKVINMSLGWWTSGISGAVVDALQASINAANAAGVVIVAAAGNDNTDAGLVTPAGLENVITVSATTSTDTKASFSNHGSVIDFSAPGSSVLSTDLSNGYAYASGTSMSAPLVAALAAMIMEQDDTATAEDVMRRLQYSALDLGTSGYDTTYGYGRIDAFKALSYDYYADGTIKTQWLEQPDENGYTRLEFDLNGKLIGGV